MPERGRPTSYTSEITAKIVELIAEGVSLKAICRREDMPARSSVNLWTDTHPEFSDRIMRARTHGAFAKVDDAGEIADTPKMAIKVVERETAEGIETTTTTYDSVDRDRLRIDHRWREAKAHAPKVFGDKQYLEHSGSIAFTDMSDDDLAAEVLELIAQGRLALPDGATLMFEDDGDHEQFA